jgi:hypothetical protein
VVYPEENSRKPPGIIRPVFSRPHQGPLVDGLFQKPGNQDSPCYTIYTSSYVSPYLRVKRKNRVRIEKQREPLSKKTV